MWTNRISQYYEQDEQSTPVVPQVAPSAAPQHDISAPIGFVAIPLAMFNNPAASPLTNLNEIYRMAYESARREANERLLELLRSRCN